MYYALLRVNGTWRMYYFLVPRGREHYIYIREQLGVPDWKVDYFEGVWGRKEYAQARADYLNGVTSVPFPR